MVVPLRQIECAVHRHRPVAVKRSVAGQRNLAARIDRGAARVMVGSSESQSARTAFHQAAARAASDPAVSDGARIRAVAQVQRELFAAKVN